MESQRKTLLSGIQPSGNLMIGNYFGALRSWVQLQDDCDCFFVLVDLHAMTVRQDPLAFRERCYDVAALYLSCGIDPERSTVFVQSHVPQHSQLAWILGCFTYMGELRRMTQFKDKAARHESNINAGLFTYPTLMAADILLFDTDIVPVGDDQRQHMELTRDLALRFNSSYGSVFKVPEPFIPEIGARLMNLQEPTAKMSKSDPNPETYIALLDSPETVRRKIRRAVTDSHRHVLHDPDRPGIANLVAIYACTTGEDYSSIEARFQGQGYGEFKRELAESLVAFLEPIQERYASIRRDVGALDRVLSLGARKARQRASVVLRRVHEALGFIPASG